MCGLAVTLNGMTIFPEAFSSVTATELEASIQITNARGEMYSLITDTNIISNSSRIIDMFYFGLSTSLATSSYLEFATTISTTFQSTFTEYAAAEVVVSIVSVTEYVIKGYSLTFIYHHE